MSETVLKLPSLHPGQKELAAMMRKYNVVPCGRRWGKTRFQLIRAGLRALRGEYYGWFAPNYKYLEEPWREFNRMFAPAISRSNATDRIIEFKTGGKVDFWTLDDPRAGRSRKYHEVGVDEAGYVSDLCDIWTASILPTLTDYDGQGNFYGTPDGRNDFYTLWQYGLDDKQPDWGAFSRPTTNNPYMSADVVEGIRNSPGMDSRTFAQEYEAEFIDDNIAYLFVPWMFEERFITPDKVPTLTQWYRGWDTATGDKQINDDTATVKCAFDPYGNLFLRGFESKKLNPAELNTWAAQIIERDGPSCYQVIEAAVTGYGIAGYMQNRDAWKKLIKLQSVNGSKRDGQGDKRKRASVWAGHAYDRKVYIVKEGQWEKAYNCFLNFTGDKTRNEEDHFVDAVSIVTTFLKESKSTHEETNIINRHAFKLGLGK
jgi:phage terminase large subunit-like protein